MTIDPETIVATEAEGGRYLVRSVRLMMIARDLEQAFHTVEALAARYEVSERTIYRDLALLQDEPLREPLVRYDVWGSMRHTRDRDCH
jgi:hypothetical protein